MVCERGCFQRIHPHNKSSHIFVLSDHFLSFKTNQLNLAKRNVQQFYQNLITTYLYLIQSCQTTLSGLHEIKAISFSGRYTSWFQNRRQLISFAIRINLHQIVWLVLIALIKIEYKLISSTRSFRGPLTIFIFVSEIRQGSIGLVQTHITPKMTIGWVQALVTLVHQRAVRSCPISYSQRGSRSLVQFVSTIWAGLLARISKVACFSSGWYCGWRQAFKGVRCYWAIASVEMGFIQGQITLVAFIASWTIRVWFSLKSFL